MSRRVTRRRVRRWALLAAVTALALRWAWTTDPALTALAVCLTATAALGCWRARCAWLMRSGQRTDLYKHYMADGTPLYYGISNHYAARCNQHADGSWWWFYVDPARSTRQTWPNRAAALHAERAAITRDCPIGNTEHNRLWRQQQPVRVLMQDQAATHRVYAQPPPVITSPTPYASRRFA